MAARPIDDIIERVNDYAETTIREKAKEYDLLGSFPEATFHHLADLGVLRIPFHRQHGGVEGTLMDILAIIRVVSRECSSTASVLLTQVSFGITPIHQFGTDEQKRYYLPSLLSGEMLGAFAMNELESGSDVSKMQTVATENEDYWELTGAKSYISHGGKAGVYSVVAKTISLDGTEGYGIFLLQPEMDGFSIGEQEEKMGIRGLPVASLEFDKVKVSKEALLGNILNGLEASYGIKDYNKLFVAAQAIGIAEGVFDRTVSYMQQDRRFGQRLIDLSNNQYKLADAYTEIYAASTMLEEIQSFDPTEKRLPAMVKLKASTVAVETSEMAILLTGGYGYMRDNDIERFVRDAKLTQIYGGGSNTQRAIISQPWVSRTKEGKRNN